MHAAASFINKLHSNLLGLLWDLYVTSRLFMSQTFQCKILLILKK